MSELSILELVAVHMDVDTLRLVSRTPLWSTISPLFSSNHFWYLRTLTCINFQLEWSPAEDWHQVYNILFNACQGNVFFPKQALDLQVNGYNSTAVRLLLKLGYNPSVDNCSTLNSAVRYGSAEIMQVLLSHLNTDVHSEIIGRVLLVAIEYNRLEVMQVLLKDSRIKQLSRAIVHTALGIAIRRKSLDSLKMIVKEVGLDKKAANSMLVIAAERGSAAIVNFLMQHPEIDVNFSGVRGERYSPIALSINNEDVGVTEQLLRSRHLVIPRDIFDRVGHYSNELCCLFLSDSRLPLDIAEAYLDYAEHIKLEARTLDLLVRRRDVDLNRLNRGILKGIIALISEYVTPTLQGCVSMSRGLFTMDSLLSELDKQDMSSYAILLREIIVKRLDIDYYIEWLKSRDEELIDRVMNSNVHTSSKFTAYRGFLMLRIKSDKSKILQTLSSEEGITEEGLQLAGALLGAYRC